MDKESQRIEYPIPCVGMETTKLKLLFNMLAKKADSPTNRDLDTGWECHPLQILVLLQADSTILTAPQILVNELYLTVVEESNR